MTPHSSRLFLTAAVISFLSAPATGRADAVASAIYGVGVQMGMVELGAHEDADPAFLVRLLRNARASAVASGCISTGEIDALITAMGATSSSRRLYGRVTAYRQQLAQEIESNCSCARGERASAAHPSWLHGAWTYRTDRGFRDTHRLLPDGRTAQGGTWSVRNGQLIVEWPNGWRNVYDVRGPTRRLRGTSIGPDGRRVPSTLERP